MSMDLKRPYTSVLGIREEVLPHELVLSIQRILDSHPEGEESNKGKGEEDLIEVFGGEFNPVDILNTYFPNETALEHLDGIQSHLAQNELDLMKQIDELQEELKKDQDPSRMQLIQEMISDLLGQVSRIREKATESEAVVRNITKEIQVLDLAKKNLILSMTTFKRLQMLVSALSQLEGQVHEKNYAEIVQTLAAVKGIAHSFKPYTSVYRISQIWKHVQEIQTELRAKIDSDWENFYAQDPSKPIKASTMSHACQVIDVLGPEVRAQFLDRYVGLELKEYRRIFKPSDEAGQLDNLSRRFAWFRRLLQTHENELGRVFPGEWRAGWFLLSKFAEITKDDLTVLLGKVGVKLGVKVFLDTLQETVDFEREMTRKFATPFADILKATQPTIVTRAARPISSAFEPHMGVYIDAQDKVLSDMLSQYRGSKSRSSLEAVVTPNPTNSSMTSSENDGATPVLLLPSSTELFYFYAQILEQCAKMFTGQPLYDLCQLFKKWLKIYAEDVLIASMKKPTMFAVRRSIETRYDAHEVKNACTLVNTADYCHTTALEMEEKIKEKVTDEFKDRISLQDECDLFVSVISSAIQHLVKEFENSCEPYFMTMQRSQWSTMSLVSGQSTYVNDLANAMEQMVEVMKPLIEQKKYERNFFDKISSAVFARFTTALVKSKPLMEIGAEQLLIDLSALKTSLLKLPGEELSTSNYTRNVTKNTTKLETLLKVIVTPVDPAEGFVLNYTLLIGDASFSNFQKILDLKGTPKLEQNDLMDTFLTITSTKNDLESTSFLSSLDMDPGQSTGPTTSSIGAGLISPGIISPATGSDASSSNKSGYAGLGVGTGGDHTSKFTDFRRFVSFAVRRDSTQPS
ncbi:VPS53 family protein [Abortiporus biennis]